MPKKRGPKIFCELCNKSYCRPGISAHRRTPLHLAKLELNNLKKSIIAILDIQDQLYNLKKTVIENQPPQVEKPKKTKRVKPIRISRYKQNKKATKFTIQQNVSLSFD